MLSVTAYAGTESYGMPMLIACNYRVLGKENLMTRFPRFGHRFGLPKYAYSVFAELGKERSLHYYKENSGDSPTEVVI